VLRPNLAPFTGAELVASSLSAPSIGGAGLPLEVTHVTENQGRAAAPSTVTRLYLSHHATLDSHGVLLATSEVAPLDSNDRAESTTTVTIPSDTEPGGYYFIAVVDAASQAVEEIENNNARPLYIRIGPELAIATLKVPATAAAGSSINVTDTVANSGGASSDPVTMRLFLSTNTKLDGNDRELHVRVVPTLAPGESSMATRPVAIPSGTAAGVYYVLGRVDTEEAVSEVNEANNREQRKIRVTVPL
jgi:subtilase family serine protease